MHKMYCDWSNASAILRAYHDEEWGRPVVGDKEHFECLMLEALLCGLSWALIMKKREILRTCFDHFDFDKIACYTEHDVQRIVSTEGMLRSVGKIKAVVENAKCFQKIRQQFGSFSAYLRDFAGGRTICYRGHAEGNIPVSNALSEKIAKDLKKRGFRYVGAITVYSYLQACGIINDHDGDCPCFQKINDSVQSVQLDPDGEVGVANYR